MPTKDQWEEIQRLAIQAVNVSWESGREWVLSALMVELGVLPNTNGCRRDWEYSK